MAKHLTPNRLYQLPPELKIVSEEEHPSQRRIDIRVELPPPEERVCPKCGFHHCVVKDSGRDQTVRHLPALKRSVFVTFHRRRFVCRDCGESYYEPVDWIHDTLHMTKVLHLDIYLKLTEMKSIRAIAEEEMVTEEVVRGVLDLIVFDRPGRLPVVLCVDEFKGDSGMWNRERGRWNVIKFQCNLTDGVSHTLIDVLPEIRADYLVSYFMQYSLEERRRVKYFSCDMHSGFIGVAKKCFPNAIICIDLFHVVKRLNDAMGAIRRRVQEAYHAESQEALRLLSTETNPLKRSEIRRQQQESFKTYKLVKNSRLLLVTKESSLGDSPEKRERLNRILSLSTDLREMHDRLQEFHLILDTKEYSLQRADLSTWLDKALASEVPEIRSAAATIKHWRGYIQNTWKYGISKDCCSYCTPFIKLKSAVFIPVPWPGLPPAAVSSIYNSEHFEQQAGMPGHGIFSC